jgi:exodeoxyribonuclease VII large subunit
MSATPLFDFAETLDKTLAEMPIEMPTVLAVPLSVTELTLCIKEELESKFDSVWVVGQVSNLTYHRSGHVYLTLKDNDSQLSATIWKSNAAKLRFQIKDGMELVCRGRLAVYPPQGKYQLSINEAEPKGIGAPELAFRQLHDKLAKLGLFDPNRKKPLPKAIRRVGVITSPTGAALRDFLQVLGRRTQLVDVLLLPVPVQGDGAAAKIAEAIRTANQLGNMDCLVVTRGGGSIEDLWAFNEEVLVRAVADSVLPIVSGVGHEIDTTLCDLAADVRAATPSEAAERIAPEDAERSRELLQLRRRLEDLTERKLRIYADKLQFFEKHPAFVRPERIIEDRFRNADLYEERLERTLDRRMLSAAEQLGKLSAALDALSPLAVLGRGYTLTEAASGSRLRSVSDVSFGNTIRTRLDDGVLESVVTDIHKESKA